MHKNERLKTFREFIEPSSLELLSVFAVFAVIIIVNQFHRLYSADLTTIDTATFKGTFLSGFTRWLGSLYHSRNLSIVAVYIFWLLIASIVYAMAFKVTKNANEIAEDIKIRHYVWPVGADRNNPMKQYLEKFGTKLIIIVTLFLYLIKLTPPLINWWKLHYVFTGDLPHNLLIGLGLFVFMALYIHGLVVLIRLFILRIRIFN